MSTPISAARRAFRRDLSPILPVPLLLAAALLAAGPASAAFTVEPLTWNIIGLDSNRPADGPRDFPVGARVCTDADSAGPVQVDLLWDSFNANIDLRPGSLGSLTFPAMLGGECVDAYFEVEVNPSAVSFGSTRRYRIVADDGVTMGMSPEPRELFVEFLISQNRNFTSTVRFGTNAGNLAVVPPGGAMNLVVGETYFIELTGGTAIQGYEQFEEFLTLSNTIFRILSVNTDYAANSSPFVANPNDRLYADACLWDNDPNSPNYRSCSSTGKTGGQPVITTYQIFIESGGGTQTSLNSLLYDFSGSSFHYNSDFSAAARIANIIDPAAASIVKSFIPATTNVGGISTLRFTLTNANAGAIDGAQFIDNLPAGLEVANPPQASTSGCGTPTFAPLAGDTVLTFTDGTIGGNSSCTIAVNVTATATGVFNNISNNLFIGTVDTLSFATATLTVNNAPPPPACTPGIELARWTMAPAQGTAVPPLFFSKSSQVGTATAAFNATAGMTNTINTASGNPVNAWSGTGWPVATVPATAGPGPNDASYFEFQLDTSAFTGGPVQIALQVNPSPTGTWASPSNITANVHARADGGPFSTIINANGITRDTWNPLSGSVTPGASTTTFRINASGRSNGNPEAPLLIDNIVFTGCGVPDPATLNKAFAPNPIAAGGTSTLTFTLSNSNAIALTGATFTDDLPAGMTVAAVPAAASTCGGTWAPAAGATTLSFSGGTIPATGSCTLAVDVTSSVPGPSTNISGFISTTESGLNSGPGGSATATLTVVIPPVIDKLFAPNPILASQVSTLTFSITNPNQNTPIGGVAFSDALPNLPGVMMVANPANATASAECGFPLFAPLPGDTFLSFSGGTILGGETCTVSVDVTVPVDDDYPNTSGNVSHLVNGVPASGNTAADTLTAVPPAPAIGLLKQVGPTAAGNWFPYLAVAESDPVFYLLTIENLGDVALSPITVSDPLVDTSGCVWPDPLPVADINDDDHIATCVIGAVTATAGETPNTATATGEFGGTMVSDQNSAIFATTGLTLVKAANPMMFTAAGEIINYTFTVTNSGAAILSSPLQINDPQIVDAACPPLNTIGNNDNFFDPGEQVVCTGSHTITAGDVGNGFFTNTATASTPETTSPPDSATVTLAGAALTIVKTQTSGPNPATVAGNVLGYTIVVTNTGNINQTGVAVSDTLPDGSAGVLTGPAESMTTDSILEVGETWTYTINYTVTQADLDNGAALVNSTSVTTNQVPGPTTDTATTPVNQNPDLTTAKALTGNADEDASGTVSVGDTLTFTITVTNTGNVTLTNVTVSDPQLTPNATSCPSVAPAATCVLTGIYVVQQTDADNGQFVNTGTGDSDQTPPVPDTVTTPVDQTENPVLGLAKTVTAITMIDSNTFAVTFRLTVENLGDVALSNVQISDDLALTFPLPSIFTVLAVSSPTLTVNPAFDGLADLNLLAGSDILALGAVATVDLMLEVELNGASGPFANSATAGGQSPLGTIVTDDSQDGLDPDPDGNGDPLEDTPTPIQIVAPLPPVAVPALDRYGLLVLLFGLSLSALWYRRERR